MQGYIVAPVAGNYTFGTSSDDGSMLFLDGQTVVNNNFYQGTTRRTGTVFLTPGAHAIDIGFYEGGGGQALNVDWTGPGIAQTTLANAVLFPNTTPALFTNDVTVTDSSAIHVAAPSATIGTLTIDPGFTLTTSGGPLAAGATTLNGGGTYTFNAGSTLVTGPVTDGAADIDLIKSGLGAVIFDNTATTQFTNAGSSMEVLGGYIVAVGQSGGTNPLGNASLQVSADDAGLVFSSKGGNVTFGNTITLEANAIISARQIHTGVAGPIKVTPHQPVESGPANTLYLNTANNYTLALNGAGRRRPERDDLVPGRSVRGQPQQRPARP